MSTATRHNKLARNFLLAEGLAAAFQLDNREGFIRLLRDVYDVRVSRAADGKIILNR